MSPLLATLVALSFLGLPLLSAELMVPVLRRPGRLLVRIRDATHPPGDSDNFPKWTLIFGLPIFLLAVLMYGLLSVSVVLDAGQPPLIRIILAVAFGFWVFWTSYLIVALAHSISGWPRRGRH